MYILIIISAFLLSSLTEYILHRFFLHRSTEVGHIKEHHAKFGGHQSYSNIHSSYKDILSGTKYIITNIIPYLLVSIYLSFTKIRYGLIFFIVAFIYTIWIEWSHYVFHHPLNTRLESLKTFKRLSYHHKLHHSYYVINYGIGSRFWDLIFRSLRTR